MFIIGNETKLIRIAAAYFNWKSMKKRIRTNVFSDEIWILFLKLLIYDNPIKITRNKHHNDLPDYYDLAFCDSLHHLNHRCFSKLFFFSVPFSDNFILVSLVFKRFLCFPQWWSNSMTSLFLFIMCTRNWVCDRLKWTDYYDEMLWNSLTVGSTSASGKGAFVTRSWNQMTFNNLKDWTFVFSILYCIFL